MQFTITLLISSLSVISSIFNTACDTAYQETSYGYQHTKKALQANNKEQLLYYAGKALEAIERSQDYLENCGCSEANNLNYDAIENLNKGLTKDTYEGIRYYVKRASTQAKNIIIALDTYTEDDLADTDGEENDLLAQEQALLEQQKQLEEQQRKLKQQLAEKQKMKEAIAAEKKLKLEEQKKLKANAEKALQEIEYTIQKMASSLNCADASGNYGSFTKSIQELDAESLNATKSFYAQKAIEMSQHLSTIMESCK